MYILAKQFGLKRVYPDNPNNTYEIPDETKVSYWILKVKAGNVYGPLTQNEFSKKRSELLIPTELKLKSVDSYQKNY